MAFLASFYNTMVIKSFRAHTHCPPAVTEHLECNADVIAVEFPSGTWVLGCTGCGHSVLDRNLQGVCRVWNQKNIGRLHPINRLGMPNRTDAAPLNPA